MLRRQRPNQRIVLAGLLGGRELNAVGDKAHLRPLLSDKIPHLNQLLGKICAAGISGCSASAGAVTTLA